LKSLIKYHFIPLTIGISLCIIFLLGITEIFNTSNYKTISIKGDKKTFKGLFANLNGNDSLELQLVGSLKEKEGLTFFGSSELTTETPYIPYNYLPDSMGIRVNSFGHAYHQSYSMYCELLALKDNLKNAKICILISPGWFEGEGTNIEAFLEFVRPNFLNRIITDNTISEREKFQIGKYLYDNLELIKNPDSKINYFLNIYKYNKVPVLNSYLLARNKEFSKVEYNLRFNKKLKNKRKQINWNNEFNKLQENFIKSIKSNNKFIADDYFNSFLKTTDGTINSAEFKEINTNNQELKDFKLLIDLLKKNKAKPSVIIQNLNPHHYKYLNRFNPTLKIILGELEKNNIPYLNMFTPEKRNYIPGTLADIMHSGNLGWMKMNKFIVDTYYAEK
jgi:D-alanine transfer protein